MKMNVLKQFCLVTGLLFFGAVQASAPSFSEEVLPVRIKNVTDGILELRGPGGVHEIAPGGEEGFLLADLKGVVLWVADVSGLKTRIMETTGWIAGRIFEINDGYGEHSFIVYSIEFGDDVSRLSIRWEGDSVSEREPYLYNGMPGSLAVLTAVGVAIVPRGHFVFFETGELCQERGDGKLMLTDDMVEEPFAD